MKQVSTMTLPDIILIGAKEMKFVMFNVSNVIENSRECWQFSTIKNPSSHIIKEDEEEGELVPILCKRESSKGGASYYETVIKKTKKYIEYKNTHVYEYSIKNPNLILPPEYYNVFMDSDTSCNWHFLGKRDFNYIPPKIPVHILNAYIECEIAKGAECPVMLTPLTKNCICTPCGHLFSKEGIEGISNCPTCRANIISSL